ncbi:N-acetylmuramoyl-L-alanine amidase [Falsochrobactrum shanghaiense]|uniref:N-acetylmuramoyl-L-alanine amidase n=1 Tax=Falsochrobactrum shanghaiense TaxID=2201899 RepID=A0A316JD89_9HYPH|nr:N-acetylmuramoyl-L-alanine amidase [Falsochrobactrum shanghaiense]PWL17013.1 N-acetylmuramoyl-L-alanine amidase [Falsochrobactrum shanghaiense]
MSEVVSADEEMIRELSLTEPDYRGALLEQSPNFGPRRDGKTPAFLILHYTGLPSAEEALQILKSPEMEVSAHYLVHENGDVVQMVSEKARAWHAGKSFWKGETDLNSASIGIEIVNPGELENYPPFAEEQIASVIRLCRNICERHQIRPEHVLAHSDIAPARKTDPGHNFPWQRLHEAGIGHLVDATPIRGGRFLARGEQGQPVEALQSMLALYGYGIEITGVFDEATEIVVKGFQRHFRPQNVDGVADVSTIDTLYRLLFSLQNVTA